MAKKDKTDTSAAPKKGILHELAHIDSDLSLKARRAIFERWSRARAALTQAQEAEQVALRAVAASLGTGPFIWNGSKYSLSSRGELLFMKKSAKKENNFDMDEDSVEVFEAVRVE